MPNENPQISRPFSRAAIWARASAGSLLFLMPLLFGGWVAPGLPTLPKALSQFRNPLLGVVALAAVFPAFRSAIARLDPERLIAPLLGFYALAFLKAAFLDYAAFALNAIDFSMYDHAMANTLAGRFMATVTGVNHFGIHATPILFLLLPFHAVFHSPYFALFLHPLLLWTGALALNFLLRREGVRGWAGLGILFAYLNSVLVARTLHYGFHVEAFYPPFGFLLLAAIGTRRVFPTLGALALFLSIKEDAPFYAIGIFLAAAATRRLGWRESFGFAAISAGVAFYFLRVLIPGNSAGTYALVGAAAGFGETPAAAVAGAFRHPAAVLRNFLAGGWWPLIVPSAGLLLQSPFFWMAALPFFGIYALAGSPLMSGLALYYGMPFVPLLFYGWIDGMKRETIPKRRAFSLAIAIGGVSLFGSGYLVFRKADLVRWRTIAPIAEEIARREASPENAGRTICAPGALIPHLGYPRGLKLLDATCARYADRIVEIDGTAAPSAPLSTYPLDSAAVAEIAKTVRDWPVVVSSGEFRLRRRP